MERHEFSRTTIRQAHRHAGGREVLRGRAEGAQGLDGGTGQGSAPAASYGELSESLQQRVELVMRFFLALGESVDALPADDSMQSSMAVPETLGMGANEDTNIFDMGRG